MRTFVSALAVLLSTTLARAEPPPPSSLRVTLEITEGAGASRRTDDVALHVGGGGEWGEVHVDSPGASASHVRLRLVSRGAPTVVFEVSRVAADKTSWTARGEVALPAPGKRVVIARVPRPSGGAAEIALTL